MIDFWNNLEEKTQVTLIIAAIGWIIAIWQFIVANKHKKSAIIFENRLKVYNEYFEKIDDINDRLKIDFQEYIGPTINQVYEKILSDPENSNQALIEMQSALSDMINKASKNINQTTQELQKLRFIASKKTLKILNEYRDLAQSQVQMIPEVLKTIDIYESRNFDTRENENLKNIGYKLIEIRNELEKQMRIDLGIN